MLQVNAAITEQMSKLSHTSNIFMHPGIHEYTKAMLDKIPEDSKLNVEQILGAGNNREWLN